MTPAIRYAWYGDDFTGAADTLATVAAAGLRTALFLSPPDEAQLQRLGPLDALGIAGTARALAPEAQATELQPVAACLQAMQPAVTHYKCCSTFDSVAEVGNLVRGVQALRRPDHHLPLQILGGQPSLGRFCAFGHLFAAAGQGGEVHRLDRHPTMSRHPVTPMHESDLRRHLAAQGLAPTALIDLRLLDAADDAIAEAALQAVQDAAGPAVLWDATRPEHLARIGRLWWRRAEQRQALLALGASSVAQALMSGWPGLRAEASPADVVAPAVGPVLVMVGSRSPVTALQADRAASAFTVVPLELSPGLASPEALDRLAARCAGALVEGGSVMARTGAVDPGGPPALEVAQATARFVSRVLSLAPQLRRVCIAGGDTSSWALRALKPWALQWAGSLAPGVPLLRARADEARIDGLELVLKGGQMGPEDLFERVVRGRH